MAADLWRDQDVGASRTDGRRPARDECGASRGGSGSGSGEDGGAGAGTGGATAPVAGRAMTSATDDATSSATGSTTGSTTDGAVHADAPVDLAEELASVAPGPALATLLDGLDVQGMAPGALVEVVAAVSREQAWLYALGAQAAAALAADTVMQPAWSEAAGGAPSQPNVAGDELALRLACSRRQANRLVRHGRAFGERLAATGDALESGRIDVTSAEIIADRLADLPIAIALDVQERVLPDAGRRTPTQLRQDLERALITADPLEAADRARRARTGRRVDRPKMLPDGMAGLWSVLPAATAVRIDATLGAAARTARAAGDPRTLDQLRADGLGDLVLRTGCLLADPSVGEPPAAAGEPAPVLGGTDILAEPRAAASCDATADGRAAVTAATDAAAHISPDVAATAGTDAPASADVHDSSRTGSSTSQGCRCGPSAHARSQVRVTVALSTLLGLDEAPAELAGYGPIDAIAARALAEGGVWRRLVTDPLSGTVLDLGRTRYRPPVGLVEHVQARDGTCARPGCTVPAESCDLDHTVEYHGSPPPSGGHVSGESAAPGLGRTSADNLSPLCRRDHRLKTDGGFVLHQQDPGVFEWRTLTGHRYRVIPGQHGRNEHLGGGRSEAPPVPGAPPPF